ADRDSAERRDDPEAPGDALLRGGGIDVVLSGELGQARGGPLIEAGALIGREVEDTLAGEVVDAVAELSYAVRVTLGVGAAAGAGGHGWNDYGSLGWWVGIRLLTANNSAASLSIGATVGSIVPAKGAIIPAAVGIVIVCAHLAFKKQYDCR